jgi:hypothetical protein
MLDDDPPVNEEDGLPYSLIDTPLKYIIETSRASPDFNEKNSPFCGLISSMHTYGLYNGRYGLSDAINLDWIPDAMRPDVDRMLVYETERQSRLKIQLADNGLIDDKLIFQAYKFLQFVDACALYFNMNPAGQRGVARFLNVPKSLIEGIDIEVVELDSGDYRFEPYPFRQERLSLYFEGRYLQSGDLKHDQNNASTMARTERQYLDIVENQVNSS